MDEGPRPNGFTRLVMGFVLAVVAVFGFLLFVLATDTENLFAWTIKVPLTAAFLGACFLGIVPGVIGVFVVRTWMAARLIVLLGVVIIGLLAIVTLQHVDEFHLATGPAFARVVAWIWVIAYCQAPFTLATAIVVQQVRGRGRPWVRGRPLAAWFRTLVTAHAAVFGTIGFGLIFLPGVFDRLWPWPLNPLAAGALGSWIAGIGFGFGWMVLENDWERARLAVASYVALVVLELVGAGRFFETLDGGWKTWIYLATASTSLILFVAAAWAHEVRSASRQTDLGERRLPG